MNEMDRTGMVGSSPSSSFMSAEVEDFNAESGEVTMRFVAPAEFGSARQFVQGGLVGGFMDSLMGSALMKASDGRDIPLNLDMNLIYLRPVPIGPLRGKGRVVKRGRQVSFLEAELQDCDGNLLVRATSTVITRPLDRSG